ncbi:unnamed protein product [Musa acuminata subsp. malaccensis]|uniref:(wild Malaysian banana) hypothetical protein n=1 Tax=Musa acuminata subsp. malaccensis TaxID=214687 RepID=A0A804I1P5_MUSAM|nr:unnamed protein product [Musa acuminata subsp. malaccensis]
MATSAGAAALTGDTTTVICLDDYHSLDRKAHLQPSYWFAGTPRAKPTTQAPGLRGTAPIVCMIPVRGASWTSASTWILTVRSSLHGKSREIWRKVGTASRASKLALQLESPTLMLALIRRSNMLVLPSKFCRRN